jgi:hypothetical protein
MRNEFTDWGRWRLQQSKLTGCTCQRASDVIAQFAALACSDLVVVNSCNDTAFLLSVLNMVITSIGLLNQDYTTPFGNLEEGETRVIARIAFVMKL